MSDEETSDSVNPFQSSGHKDYDPFGTGQADQASSYEVKTFATAYHEPESMNQVLLAPQSIEVDNEQYYIGGAYDELDEEEEEDDDTDDDLKKLTDAQLDRREEAIFRREQSIKHREKGLIEREKEARLEGGPADNWPCAGYPIAYHSIPDEIPTLYQSQCRKMYNLTLATIVTLVWNWLCLMAFWTEDYLTGSGPFLWGTIFVLVGVPGAWKLWYRNIYFAFRDGRIKNWFCYFFWMTVHTGFSLSAAIGIPGSYLVGFVHMIDAFSKSTSGLGMMAMICAFLWIVNAYCSVKWLRETWSIYQTSGKSSSELVAEAYRIGSN